MNLFFTKKHAFEIVIAISLVFNYLYSCHVVTDIYPILYFR